MNDRITHRYLCVLLLMASLMPIGNLWAGQEEYTDGKDYSKEVVPVEKSWCETPSLWEFRVGAPGWLAGISGESGVLGLFGSTDVTFSQLFRHLTHVPIVLSAELRYGRWEIFGDGQYME